MRCTSTYQLCHIIWTLFLITWFHTHSNFRHTGTVDSRSFLSRTYVFLRTKLWFAQIPFNYIFTKLYNRFTDMPVLFTYEWPLRPKWALSNECVNKFTMHVKHIDNCRHLWNNWMKGYRLAIVKFKHINFHRDYFRACPDDFLTIRLAWLWNTRAS